MAKDHTPRHSKRIRVNFTQEQLGEMEQMFARAQYPDPLELEGLSDRHGIPIHKLCTWFQNRRSKFRRDSKNGHIEWMRGQLYEGHKTSRPHSPDGATGQTKHVLSPTAGTGDTQDKSPTANIQYMPTPKPTTTHGYYSGSSTYTRGTPVLTSPVSYNPLYDQVSPTGPSTAAHNSFYGDLSTPYARRSPSGQPEGSPTAAYASQTYSPRTSPYGLTYQPACSNLYGSPANSAYCGSSDLNISTSPQGYCSNSPSTVNNGIEPAKSSCLYQSPGGDTSPSLSRSCTYVNVYNTNVNINTYQQTASYRTDCWPFHNTQLTPQTPCHSMIQNGLVGF